MPDSAIPNGSAIDSPDARAATVRYCLRKIISQLMETSFVLGTESKIANDRVDVMRPTVTGDVVVCTTEHDHLWDKISTGTFIKQRKSRVSARLLPYECRRVFAENIGRYDIYAYIEDDMAIHDSSFFEKITSLYKVFGENLIFLPNRYEIFGEMDGAWKAYIDIPVTDHYRVECNTNGQNALSIPNFSGDVVFERTQDLTSGCFFITDHQLITWTKSEDFKGPPQYLLDRPLDPLEISQIPMLGAFPVYRPVSPNMNFLEVHHVPTRATRMTTPRRKIVQALQPEIARRKAISFDRAE
jgi:hypothetical protein